jgi:hypothetical protein
VVDKLGNVQRFKVQRFRVNPFLLLRKIHGFISP